MSETQDNPQAFSSRSKILDVVDLVANLQAYQSHLKEYRNYLLSEIKKTGDESYRQDIETINTLLKGARSIRKEYMKELEAELEAEPKLWCAIKHIMCIPGLSEEILEASSPEEQSRYEILAERSFNLMSSTVAYWAGVKELSFCARCDLDKIQE